MNKIFSQLIGVFGMVMMFAVSGWGACSGTLTGTTWNTSSSVSYSSGAQTVLSGQQDLYTISVGTSGQLDVSVYNDDQAQDLTATLYSDSTCGTALWSQSLSQGNSFTRTTTVSPGTYMLYIIGNHASQVTDYHFNGMFTSAQPPILSSIPDQYFTVGTPFNLNLSTFTTPTDGDSILGYAVVSGTQPAWLSFDTTTGLFSGTPSAGSTFTLDVNARDKDGNSTTRSVNFTSNIIAAPPVMSPIPNQDIVNGVPFSLSVSSYASGSGITSYTLTPTPYPAGLSFNSATGVFSGTPTANGTYTLHAYATNASGDSNTVDFNITVSTAGTISNLLIVKNASVRYSDINKTVTYIITLANETASAISASFTDILSSYYYNQVTSQRGALIDPPLDLNLTIIDEGVFDCVDPTASSFTCTGTVPRRTGQGGVPGLVRITYSITTPTAPVPALLFNNARITGTITEVNATVIVSSGGIGGIPVTPPPMHADVIDTDMWQGSAAYNAGTSKVIKTKIAAKTNVSLTAVHLDGNTLATPFINALGDDSSFLVVPYISDGTCSSQDILYDSTTGLAAVFNITNNNTTDTKQVTMPDYANQIRRLSVSFIDLAALNVNVSAQNRCYYNSSTTGNLAGLGQCVNSANNYYDAFGLSAYERCQTMNGNPCSPDNHGYSCGPGNTTCPGYNPIYHNELGCLMCTLNAFPDCSSDNFAIRPKKMEIVSSHYDWSSILRSAQDYNTTITAYNYNNVPNTAGYNVTNANTVFTIVPTKYDRNNDVNTSMTGSARFATAPFDMLNGLSVKNGVNEVAGLTFDDVGKVNLSIQDQNWSIVDINNPRDTTPHDCSANGAYVCGDTNVTFIPHHFDFETLTITNNNGNPGSFTYIANEVGQMAGRIHTKMRALNKENNVTQNFQSVPLWENPITVIPVVRKATYIYPDANETNITNLAVGFGTLTDANGTKTIAWDETNASKYLRFNFQRDVNQPFIPFDVNGSDLNISMVSHYVDGIKTADINGSRLGTGVNDLPYTIVSPANGLSTFVYGRVNPIGVNVIGDMAVSAQSYMEVYGTSPVTIPTIPFSTQLAPSKMGSDWWINAPHNNALYGDAIVTVTSPAGHVPASNVLANGVTTYSSFPGIPVHITVPLEFEAHIKTMPWLWYGVNALVYEDPVNGDTTIDCLNHPCFNVKIRSSSSSWVGGGSDKGNKAQQKSTTEQTMGEDMLLPRIRQ